MNPGIFYLYEYKNNQKQRNVGFLKLIRHYQTCTVQLQARGIPVARQDTLKLSAFYMENETAHAQIVAEIFCDMHAISARVTIAESHLPDKRSLNNIHGFLLPLPNGTLLAATVPGITLNTHDIRYLEKRTEPPARDQSESAQPEPEVSSKAVPEAPAPTDSEVPSKTTPEALTPPQVQIEAESLDLCAIPSTCAASNDSISPTKPASSAENISTESTSASVEPASTELSSASEKNAPSKELIRKILRSEMSCLPRKYWNLANNSFLLHGYHNYNHLLLVEKDGHYWLGVPGIYDPREARAAELFGFPQFTDSYNKELTLTEEERNDCGTFGYWCRYLK